MRKFKVQDKKDLKIGGYGGRYFKPGDVVNENDFMPGTADVLVENGELKEIHEIENLESDESDKGPTKKDIIASLTDLGVDFKPSQSKAELQEILATEIAKSDINESDENEDIDLSEIDLD